MVTKTAKFEYVGQVLRFEELEDERGHRRFECRQRQGFLIESADEPDETFHEFIGSTIIAISKEAAEIKANW